jgi:hypothetical protein
MHDNDICMGLVVESRSRTSRLEILCLKAEFSLVQIFCYNASFICCSVLFLCLLDPHAVTFQLAACFLASRLSLDNTLL